MNVAPAGHDDVVLFADLAATSVAVAATSGRRAKVELLAGALRALAATGDPREIEAGAAYLAGEMRQRQIGVGYAGLRDLPPPSETATPSAATPSAAAPSAAAGAASSGVASSEAALSAGARSVAAVSVVALPAAPLSAAELSVAELSVAPGSVAPRPVAALSVAEVDARLAEIAVVTGPGSQARRRALVQGLFAAATADEQRLLVGIISGEVRQGAQAGLLTDAIASAAAVPQTAVRRALLLSGDLKTVAVAALIGGDAALSQFRLTVGRALAPMLAQAASGIDEALAATGVPASVDAKLDGIRVQVHRDGNDVVVFSRSLDDITARVPEIVAVTRQLPVRTAVLDGEALAVDTAGRPRPFQETSGRAARQSSGSLTPFFFDALHIDGTDLVDEPGTTRWAALDASVPEEVRVARTLVESPEQAEAAFLAALSHGQEGVVIKALGSTYDVGRRGSAWVKVKPRHTLDLVILAAEWGHGRRRGWLSNLHLGARDPGRPAGPSAGPAAGGFVMLGKTFKGLTDAMLAWQTTRLLELATERGEWVVTVRPELVVEIAFDGVQASTRYPGGVTLRFARVLRYREYKSAAEVDTIDAVRALSHAAHRDNWSAPRIPDRVPIWDH